MNKNYTKVKYLFLTLTLVFVFCLISPQNIFADTIGYLDMDKIVFNYGEAKKIQDELKTKGEALQKEVEKKQEEIEKAKSDNKKESEIEELITKTREELKVKQEQILAFQVEAQRKILSTIMDTANEVAKEYGIDVVLDKKVVYAGGFDLTDFVLEKLGR